MALTRAFLKGLSLTKEQEDSIIEQHTETVEALKQQIADIQKQVESNEDFKFSEGRKSYPLKTQNHSDSASLIAL